MSARGVGTLYAYLTTICCLRWNNQEVAENKTNIPTLQWPSGSPDRIAP